MVQTLEAIIRFVLNMYTFLIFGYVLMSWIPQLRDSAVGRFISQLVEPFLRPFKQLIPPIGMIDISAIVALFTLHFAEEGIIYLLYLLA